MALATVEQPALEGHGPPHIVVAVPTSDRAAVLETFRRGTSPDSGEGRVDDQIAPCPAEGAAATACSQGAVPEVTLAVDPLEELIEKERQRVKMIQEAPRDEESPCIWRVHPSIREQESDAYEPKLISIGPLHHLKDSLLPMEEIKLSYLNSLLGRSCENKLSNYIKVIRECEPQARKQYAEEVPLASDEFVTMLVIDGCFIIEYLVKRVLKETKKTVPLSGVRWGFSHLRRDLMLLENQIPFFVLVRLFDLSKIPFTGTRSSPLTLMEIALGFLHFGHLPQQRWPDDVGVRHLLHLHHICLDPSGPDEPCPWRYGECFIYPVKVASRLISMLFFGLLYMVLIHKWPLCCFPTEEPGVPRMIPCATQLRQAGVKFKKKDGVSSYLKVSFTDGDLEIPYLPVQESTSSKLRNFIALEQCYPQAGSYFTSYAVLMNNLINTKSDVEILQQRGIIESKLGSDKEVADLFNNLCKGTHLDFKEHHNAPLFKVVKKYCEVPHHKWRASLRSTHLSSPWSTISLVVAILIFGLAITQAYFVISRRTRK